MFAGRAFELIKELDRSAGSSLTPFDENGLRQIFTEMQALFEKNQHDVSMSVSGESGVLPGLHLRHAALERNKQCVLAYTYNRAIKLRDMRWSFGSVMSENVRLNTTEQEQLFFRNYNKVLANYMQSVGDDSGTGLDLTQDIQPPKVLSIQVKVLQDWELENEIGEPVYLKKDSYHFLSRPQCEPLVRQGILEYVNS